MAARGTVPPRRSGTYFSPERIKRALGSSTNVAFERYYNIELDEVREVFSQTSGATSAKHLPHLKKLSKIGKALKS